MIVPMKKYSFLIFYKEYESFLKGLQEIGVVHIVEKQKGEIIDETLRDKYILVDQFNQVINILKSYEIECPESVTFTNIEESLKILKEIQQIKSEQDQRNQQISTLKKELKQLEPWGNFSPELIKKLKENNIYLSFFICPESKFHKEWEEKYTIEIINNINNWLYFVVIHGKDEIIELPGAEEIKAPEKSYNEVQKQIDDLLTIQNESQKILKHYAKKYINALEISRDKILETIEFEKVKLNTEKHADNKLLIIEGWVPEEKEKELQNFINRTGVLAISENPTKEDNVPVALKNNKFSRLFEPIGDLFMLPTYHELDLTPFFAPFFMLFFGFCMGDAGYGLLILLATTFLKFKVKSALKSLLTLAQFLGLATILFGIISGTFFGMNLIDSGYTLTQNSFIELSEKKIPQDITEKLATLKDQYFKTRSKFENEITKVIGNEDFKKYRNIIISSADTNFKLIKKIRYFMLDSSNMFNLALIIGALQIIFAMFVRILNITKQKAFIYSLPVVGWLVLIIGLITLIVLKKSGIINDLKPYIYIVLSIFGFLLLFFSNPGKIFSSIGSGLADIYFTTTGFLGDLLSYIRLFALALSSSILGYVFNDLALKLLEGIPILGAIFFVVLLLVGHTINLLLSALGSFVHPMRLTFVEFYKNAGFTYSGGMPYKPFKSKVRNQLNSK